MGGGGEGVLIWLNALALDDIYLGVYRKAGLHSVLVHIEQSIFAMCIKPIRKLVSYSLFPFKILVSSLPLPYHVNIGSPTHSILSYSFVITGEWISSPLSLSNT